MPPTPPLKQGSETLLVRLYEDNVKFWDTCHRGLTRPIPVSSIGGYGLKMEWPILFYRHFAMESVPDPLFYSQNQLKIHGILCFRLP